MAQGQVARAIANLQWVHSTTEKLTQGWPADKVTYQTTPTDNHVIWTMGHLASTYEWWVIVKSCGRRTVTRRRIQAPCS
jgi:hypothetical protein